MFRQLHQNALVLHQSGARQFNIVVAWNFLSILLTVPLLLSAVWRDCFFWHVQTWADSNVIFRLPLHVHVVINYSIQTLYIYFNLYFTRGEIIPLRFKISFSCVIAIACHTSYGYHNTTTNSFFFFFSLSETLDTRGRWPLEEIRWTDLKHLSMFYCNAHG